MATLQPVSKDYIRNQYKEFVKKTDEFYDRKMNMKDYKGFSGRFGSYAQRGMEKSMLRLRMNAGALTKEKLRFVIDQCEKHNIDMMHLTTCQTIQLHNLDKETVYSVMNDALDADIICYGGGGDFPRNVMCSPLSGTEKGEYFDVMPYAKASAGFLLQFIDEEKMPRKLKVGFSSSPTNKTHATFRDIGFVAREDGLFDVYIAGGLGNQPKLGILAAQAVDPKDILYYLTAMIETFRAHGNYDNRAKARTRFMQDTLGEEKLREVFLENVAKVKERDDLDLEVEITPVTKTGDGSVIEESFLVKAQKQDGLYSVLYHPAKGNPPLSVMKELENAAGAMDQVELRISPDESIYIVNLTGNEAQKILDIIAETAASNTFETSFACVGASICQVGLRDSSGVLTRVLKEVKEAGLSDQALPRIQISGCTSSCATHQIAPLGFRGAVKVIDKKPQPAFVLYADGQEVQGKERLGDEKGMILETDIAPYLIELGKAADASGLDFLSWKQSRPAEFDEITARHLV